MMKSREAYLGESVLCAYGTSEDGHTLTCGLLFVRERLLPGEYPVVVDGRSATVMLPESMLGLAEPKYFVNATLSVLEAT